MVRFKSKRKTKKTIFTGKGHNVEDLDITSLIDILTILLVFMLKNISMDSSQKEAPQGMELPTTISTNEFIEGGQAIFVKIYPDKILYGSENINVGTLEDFMTKEETRKVLFRHLEYESQKIAEFGNTPCLLIQAEKELECRYITEFMKFSANAAFANIYFSSIKTDNKNEVLGI